MKTAFKVPVGLSDHSLGSNACLVALGLGGRIFEKHVTLSCNQEGPDHVLSLDPIQQKQFVDDIRSMKTALGTGLKQPTKQELVSEIRFKKSIYSSCLIKSGQKISADQIQLMAPCFGLLPKYTNMLLNASEKTFFLTHPAQ